MRIAKHQSAAGPFHALAARLRRELQGEVLFDAFSRGRYSTDASFYQIQPIGVVVPRHLEDVVCVLQIAAEHGVPVLPRGAGTSQCGQTVGAALVIDASKYLTGISTFDPAARSITVEPGVVLDQLNEHLKPHGLFFPVDISTSSRATLGGMTGNNSVGARSIRYGHMVDNVRAIDALLAGGEQIRFDAAAAPLDARSGETSRRAELIRRMRALYEREADELERRLPKVKRHVAGYNLHRLGRERPNFADVLVGSEGTLAWFARIELALAPIPPARVVGVCHFPTFAAAMASAQHIVALDPSAVELIDRTVIELARDNPAFRAAMSEFLRGDPEALLLVEFAGESSEEQLRALERLSELMGDLGFPDAVVPAIEPALQRTIWEVRKAALNIVMSMKGDGKPVSFIEDCAVPLDKLAEYTDRLTAIFSKHGTSGTWYAHASVGCLHVRPILNLKEPAEVAKLRTIAAEAHALVREYKGSHSGEHGDGLVRSEFIESMLGERLARAFAEIKASFDPGGLFNPGKIVAPPRMDDRSLFRFPEGYRAEDRAYALDWSEWGGFHRATEMCNNNGACRKASAGVMCPSYRVTRDEQHLTRGRANSLRLAVTGQLGPEALSSREMFATLDLCVGCKACKRECPTGVDVSRMKIEFLHHYRQRWGLRLKDRLIAYLPRYAPWAARWPRLANLPGRAASAVPGLQALLGFAPQRPLPTWRGDRYRPAPVPAGDGPEVVLWADTFSAYFEPEIPRAAEKVLTAGGYRLAAVQQGDGERPLCCGRTFMSAGLLDEARAELRRLVSAFAPHLARGVPIVGLEPSCLLTLRDELGALLPEADAKLLAKRALLLPEFLLQEHAAGRLRLPLRALPEQRAVLHGHCHEKAFGLMPAVAGALRLVPGLEVEMVETSCCGMAGAFGYDANHYSTSMQMAELALLPAIRKRSPDTLIVADGTSCRRQILDGTGRRASHAAEVLARALAG